MALIQVKYYDLPKDGDPLGDSHRRSVTMIDRERWCFLAFGLVVMEKNLPVNDVSCHSIGGFKSSETVRFLAETYRNHPAYAIPSLWIYIVDETNMN